METKVCKECKNKLPLDMFYKSKDSTQGVRGRCKECDSKYWKQFYEKNREKKLKCVKQYSEENKEKIKQYQNNYILKNREAISKRAKIYRHKYYNDNKENISEKSKEYYLKNKEHISERCKTYYIENIDKHRKLTQKYRMNNKNKFCIYGQKRSAMKKQLAATLTAKQWEDIKSQFGNKCCYCGKELPLTQDHFVPLSKGGEYSHNNILPSCLSCNSSKNNKDFPKWYPKYRYYSKKREIFILEFLNYKGNNQQLTLII